MYMYIYIYIHTCITTKIDIGHGSLASEQSMSASSVPSRFSFGVQKKGAGLKVVIIGDRS